MKLTLALLIAALVYAETPKPAPQPTIEQQQTNLGKDLDQALAVKAFHEAQIKWLESRLQILQAQMKAITDYYAATEALRQSDAAKPAEPKAER
jgi:hypothetical protein